MAESMTVDQPVTEEVTQPSVNDEAKELMAELSRLGVKNPEQLQGMAVASREAGNLANMLGGLRNENAELKRMIQDLQRSSKQQDYNSGYDGNTINLEDTMAKVVKNVYFNEILKPQQEAQAKVYRELSAVRSDDDYSVVGEGFEKHLSSPDTQIRLNSGEASISGEYQRFVRAYYRTVAQRSKKVLEDMTKAGMVKPPHVESGDTKSAPLPGVDEERKSKLNNIIKQREAGTLNGDSALDAIISTMFK